MSSYALNKEEIERLKADYATHKYTQEKLAEKYIISRATAQRYIHGWTRKKVG